MSKIDIESVIKSVKEHDESVKDIIKSIENVHGTRAAACVGVVNREVTLMLEMLSIMAKVGVPTVLLSTLRNRCQSNHAYLIAMALDNATSELDKDKQEKTANELSRFIESLMEMEINHLLKHIDAGMAI